MEFKIGSKILYRLKGTVNFRKATIEDIQGGCINVDIRLTGGYYRPDDLDIILLED